MFVDTGQGHGAGVAVTQKTSLGEKCEHSTQFEVPTAFHATSVLNGTRTQSHDFVSDAQIINMIRASDHERCARLYEFFMAMNIL
jgi:hypothetical protein